MPRHLPGLEKLRLEAKLSKRKLADMAGIAPNTYYAMQAGRPASAVSVVKVLEVLQNVLKRPIKAQDVPEIKTFEEMEIGEIINSISHMPENG